MWMPLPLSGARPRPAMLAEANQEEEQRQQRQEQAQVQEQQAQAGDADGADSLPSAPPPHPSIALVVGGHGASVALPSLAAPSGSDAPAAWAVEAANLFASRALRPMGVHVMEIVSHAKKRFAAQGLTHVKQWSKPVFLLLQADERIVMKEERFVRNTDWAGNAPTAAPVASFPRLPLASASSSALAPADQWVERDFTAVLHLLQSKPPGDGMSKKEFKSLSKSAHQAAGVTPKQWRKAIKAKMRSDPRTGTRGTGTNLVYLAVTRTGAAEARGTTTGTSGDSHSSSASCMAAPAAPRAGNGKAPVRLLGQMTHPQLQQQQQRAGFQMSAPLEVLSSELPTYDERIGSCEEGDGYGRDWDSEADDSDEQADGRAAAAPAPQHQREEQQEEEQLEAEEPDPSLPLSASSNARFADLFLRHQGVSNASSSSRGFSLLSGAASEACPERGLLGTLLPANGAAASASLPPETVHLNTHEPFCLVTVGVQGSGKSHTLGAVLENCLLPCPVPYEESLVRLRRPLTALVLHFDQNAASVCEATGLATPAPALAALERNWHMARDRVVVLVSPSNYKQRRQFYGDRFTVKPLLLPWRHLTADHLKRLMRIKDADQQLYVASMLELLRKYQRRGGVPEFASFLREIQALCKLPGQGAALSQRIALLQSIIRESSENDDIRAESAGLSDSLCAGTLVIVDLTDPLLARDEANGIFQVLVEQFRALPLKGALGGRLLVLDEAHRFMDGQQADGLSDAIVDAARLMRHDGLRLAISTQSPKALAPELLELVSVAVLHRFHSRDWMEYLRSKTPLEPAHFQQLMELAPGEALVFAGRHRIGGLHAGTTVFPMWIRPRLTADRGASRTNVTGADNNRAPSAPATRASDSASSPGPATGSPLVRDEQLQAETDIQVRWAAPASTPAATHITAAPLAHAMSSAPPPQQPQQQPQQAHPPHAMSSAPAPIAAAASHLTDADLVSTICCALLSSGQPHLSFAQLGEWLRKVSGQLWKSLRTPRSLSLADFIAQHDEAFQVSAGSASAPHGVVTVALGRRKAEQTEGGAAGLHPAKLAAPSKQQQVAPLPPTPTPPPSSSAASAGALRSLSDAQLIDVIHRAIRLSGQPHIGISLLGNAISDCSHLNWATLAAPRVCSLKSFLLAHPSAFEIRDAKDPLVVIAQPSRS